MQNDISSPLPTPQTHAEIHHFQTKQQKHIWEIDMCITSKNLSFTESSKARVKKRLRN